VGPTEVSGNAVLPDLLFIGFVRPVTQSFTLIDRESAL